MKLQRMSIVSVWLRFQNPMHVTLDMSQLPIGKLKVSSIQAVLSNNDWACQITIASTRERMIIIINNSRSSSMMCKQNSTRV